MSAYRFLGWCGKATKDGRANPVAMREMLIVMKYASSNGRWNKRNPQLLYELATWVNRFRQGTVPVRALAEFWDVNLFDILIRHGEIPSETIWWETISPTELNKLEKRLHHIWPIVNQIATDLRKGVNAMRKAKPVTAQKATPSSRKRHRIAKPQPGSAWQLGLSNLSTK